MKGVIVLRVGVDDLPAGVDGVAVDDLPGGEAEFIAAALAVTFQFAVVAEGRGRAVDGAHSVDQQGDHVQLELGGDNVEPARHAVVWSKVRAGGVPGAIAGEESCETQGTWVQKYFLCGVASGAGWGPFIPDDA